VAAIFPEHFQSFTVTLKNYYFDKFFGPQTVPAVCQSINRNKKTHSSKDKSAGSYKSRDSLQTLSRTFHERDAELAKGDHTEVWVEEFWLSSSPDCKPFDFFECGVSELRVKAKSRNKSKDLIKKMKEVMGSLARDTLAKACTSFRSRSEALFTADGSFIEYVDCKYVRGASKIKLKKVNKKRTVTVRRLIIFLNISRHPLRICLQCCLHQYKTLKAVATAAIVLLTPAKNLKKVFLGFLVVSPLFNHFLG
jgi:hypothetical protein